jgi:group I intron endonuclease
MNFLGIIYKAINKINDCGYIGQTTNTIEGRKSDHKKEANGKRSNTDFHKAIREFGFDNFTWDTLCECNTNIELDHAETDMIELHKTHISQGGYNKQIIGGTGSNNWKHTEESKRKIKIARSKQIITEETKQKMSKSLKGRIFTDEHKKKIGDSRKGNHHTEETKNKISNTLTGLLIGEKNPFYGKHHTEETKQKLKNILSGKNSSLSKKYIIEDTKNNLIFEVHGLRAFCKEHPEYNAYHTGLSDCALGKRKHHKGLKCAFA